MYNKITFFLLCLSSVVYGALDVPVSSKAAILMNAETGAVLFEKNAQEELFPASVTKIATALYALREHPGDMQELVTADQDSVGWGKAVGDRKKIAYRLEPGGTHAGIQVGEKLPFIDLMYLMMVLSANDASNMIARHLGGSIPAFMDGMNAYLESLGCHHTHFINPHGLGRSDHYTTAYDMALITKEALKQPLFRQIIAATSYNRAATNKRPAELVSRGNRFLRPWCDYSKGIGGKTGRLELAKNTFVGIAEDKGRILIAVLLACDGREERFKDAIRLFEAAFNEKPIYQRVVAAGAQPWTLKIEGAARAIQATVSEEQTIRYYPSETPQIKAHLRWGELELPVYKDQQIGTLDVVDARSGMLLRQIPLLATEDVGPSLTHRLKMLFQHHPVALSLGGVAFVAGIGFLLRRRRR